MWFRRKYFNWGFWWCVNSPTYEKQHLMVKKTGNELVRHALIHESVWPLSCSRYHRDGLFPHDSFGVANESKSLRKDMEILGGFIWKFENRFHHGTLPLKVKPYEKDLCLIIRYYKTYCVSSKKYHDILRLKPIFTIQRIIADDEFKVKNQGKGRRYDMVRWIW